MCHVELYDVVERKYAGFSQIVNDAFYGWSEDHPYWKKMEQGLSFKQRETVAKNWTGKRGVFGLKEWIYLFLFHRLTGSAINYAKKPSGYHNTLLFEMHQADNIPLMVTSFLVFQNLKVNIKEAETILCASSYHNYRRQ
jgi:hypothetical protein